MRSAALQNHFDDLGAKSLRLRAAARTAEAIYAAIADAVTAAVRHRLFQILQNLLTLRRFVFVDQENVSLFLSARHVVGEG